MARADHRGCRVSGDRVRRRRCDDGRSCAPCDDPAAADAQRTGGVETVRIPGARLREGDSGVRHAEPSSPDACFRCRRRTRSGSSWWATPAVGCSPRSGSSRRATTPRSGRSRRSPARRRTRAPISSFTSVTITTARTRARVATPDARAARGATAGMRGRPICSPLRKNCSPPRHGSSCAATTSRAVAPGRAGGDSSIRARYLPDRTATRPRTMRVGDYSEPYAVPLGSAADADTQFIVFDSSLVGVLPLPPSDAMHVRYRGAVRACVRARGAAPQHVLHEPPSDARVRAESGASPTPLSRATARCNRCWERCSRRCSSRLR